MLKGLIRILIVLLILAVLGLCALILPVWWMETHLPPDGDADVIVVLGAQVKPDGSPSVALERRMTVALRAYQEKPRLILCCGARGGNEPEAEGTVMRSWMIANGVPESDVIAETESVNTRQNLLNAKKIMEEHGLVKPLLVTSDYHVARALALAKQIGLDAVGRGSPSKPEYFLKNHIQEGLSWVKFLLETAMGKQ